MPSVMLTRVFRRAKALEGGTPVVYFMNLTAQPSDLMLAWETSEDTDFLDLVEDLEEDRDDLPSDPREMDDA